jgi:hypothetical protein
MAKAVEPRRRRVGVDDPPIVRVVLPEVHQHVNHRLAGLSRRLEQGGRELWACLREGTITETEIRDATMARFVTWLSASNRMKEPPSDAWASPELERCFEIALLGRPAKPPGG